MLSHWAQTEFFARYDVIIGSSSEFISISLFRLRPELSNKKVKRRTFECEQLEDKFL